MSDSEATTPAAAVPAAAPTSTGLLSQPTLAYKGGGSRKARQSASADRTALEWQCVTITEEHDVNPRVACKFCDWTGAAGATRVRDHILCNGGSGGVRKCKGCSPEYLTLKAKLEKKSEGKKADKAGAQAVAEVNEAADEKKPLVVLGGRQQGIKSSLASGASEELDNAIAELFYGENLDHSLADKPRFRKVLNLMKTAPASYKPPDRKRVGGELLRSTTKRLKTQEEPARKAGLEDGGTVVSDGWDDVERNHLINLLLITSKGTFFDGTFKLSSTDHEDAQAVAKIIIDEINRVGCLDVIQVVTDTCSVMKAAWKIIMEEFPWITCTCCGPHVLSLELQDMGKIKEVKAVMKKTSKILNRFWGRKRWARTKLKEVTERNHGKKIGLYRAKKTRFAGRVREMGRVLRLKADLQQVVVSAEYAQQKFDDKKKEGEAEEAEEAESEEEDGEEAGADAVKKIVLDENGYWKPAVDALRVMTPTVKLLRLCDGEKPAMGKVYERMYMIGEKIKERSVSWKAKAAKIHSDRWEYLHSVMHAAGYALDPEFLETVGDLDAATQEGLMTVVERLMLRDVIASSENPMEARKTITMEDDVVQERIGECIQQLATYQAKEGIFTKPYVLKSAKDMAPAAWWRMYGKHIPLVKSVAIRVLSQPVCASAAERNWSVYGQIKTKERSRMGHETGDMRVYCHEALHLQDKMQSAGYKAKVEMWDSDSDSDETDEEDLMV